MAYPVEGEQMLLGLVPALLPPLRPPLFQLVQLLPRFPLPLPTLRVLTRRRVVQDDAFSGSVLRGDEAVYAVEAGEGPPRLAHLRKAGQRNLRVWTIRLLLREPRERQTVGGLAEEKLELEG